MYAVERERERFLDNKKTTNKLLNKPGNNPKDVEKKKSSNRKNPWGTQSYADLITRAIENSPDGRLTLSQIYDWMVKNVPHFSDKGDNNSSAGWKNSIRHNLSLHTRFIRIENESTGKSSWWAIDPNAGEGRATRRRSTSERQRTRRFKNSRNRSSQSRSKRPQEVLQQIAYSFSSDLSQLHSTSSSYSNCVDRCSEIYFSRGSLLNSSLCRQPYDNGATSNSPSLMLNSQQINHDVSKMLVENYLRKHSPNFGRPLNKYEENISNILSISSTVQNESSIDAHIPLGLEKSVFNNGTEENLEYGRACIENPGTELSEVTSIRSLGNGALVSEHPLSYTPPRSSPDCDHAAALADSRSHVQSQSLELVHGVDCFSQSINVCEMSPHESVEPKFVYIFENELPEIYPNLEEMHVKEKQMMEATFYSRYDALSSSRNDESTVECIIEEDVIEEESVIDIDSLASIHGNTMPVEGFVSHFDHEAIQDVNPSMCGELNGLSVVRETMPLEKRDNTPPSSPVLQSVYPNVFHTSECLEYSSMHTQTATPPPPYRAENSLPSDLMSCEMTPFKSWDIDEIIELELNTGGYFDIDDLKDVSLSEEA